MAKLGYLAIAAAALLPLCATPGLSTERPLSQEDYKEIVRRYSFVGDFSQKPDEREISDELFWRYPYRLPKIEFEPYPGFDDIEKEMPATVGGDMPSLHLNRGRAFYLEGDFENAKAAWLTGKAIYGNSYDASVRADYYIGYAFANLAFKHMKEAGVGLSDPAARGTLANATTFLSWAFNRQIDSTDPVIQYATPKAFYNLAAIYWQYDRYAAAFGAATKGLEYLRAQGRDEFRPQFRRLLAENLIKNRSYLEAVQQLDVGIRQDYDPVQGAAMFARVGDIYFDLNNYELAVDAYDLSERIDREEHRISPLQLVLKGEALFWLGRFSEAQKVLDYALEGSTYRKSTAPMDVEFSSFAALRMADSYFARGLVDEAKLYYFKVESTYRGTPASSIARVRRACLELPFYKGNNVKHARDLLWVSKDKSLPMQAQELAWACHVNSYTQRERNVAMVDRVRDFFKMYPRSRFLGSMIEPVKDVQASKLLALLKQGKHYSAISYYEQNRDLLFSKLSDVAADGLFSAYVDTSQEEKAAEFFQGFEQRRGEDANLLRRVLVTSLLRDKAPKWARADDQLARTLATHKWTILPQTKPRESVARLLNRGGDRHQLWLNNLAKHWLAQDSSTLCAVAFPVLAKFANTNGSERTAQRLADIIETSLPKLLESDHDCAISMLELEYELATEGKVDLGKRYLLRQPWPMSPEILQIVWTVAEDVARVSQRALARELWQVILSKGSEASPYVRFAKARLDPTRTEFEKLWD